MISKKSIVASTLLSLAVFQGAMAQQEGQPVRLSVSVVALVNDNRDAAPYDKKDTVDIFLRPRAELRLTGATTVFDAHYEPGLRYRSEPGDNQDEIDLQHSFGMGARHQVSERLRLRAQDRLMILDDPKIEENGAVVRGDLSYLLNIAEIGLNYDLFRYSNLDVLVMNRVMRFEEKAVATLSDKDESSLRVQHRRRLTPTLRTLLTGEYRMYQYRRGPLESRDFNSMIGAVGLENLFTPNTIGSVSLGWQTRDYDDASLDSEGKPYVHADLSGMLSPDLRIGATAGYGLRDSSAYPYPSQEYTEFRGFAHIGLAPNLMLRLSGTYRMSKYEAYRLSAGGDENLLVADVELLFNMTEWTSLLVGHRIEDVDSDATVGESYVRNTTRVGAFFAF